MTALDNTCGVLKVRHFDTLANKFNKMTSVITPARGHDEILWNVLVVSSCKTRRHTERDVLVPRQCRWWLMLLPMASFAENQSGVRERLFKTAAVMCNSAQSAPNFVNNKIFAHILSLFNRMQWQLKHTRTHTFYSSGFKWKPYGNGINSHKLTSVMYTVCFILWN